MMASDRTGSCQHAAMIADKGMPTDNHESNSAKPIAALFAIAQKASFVPPVFAPNGVAH